MKTTTYEKLMLVVREASESRIRGLLDRFAPMDWESLGNIRLITIPRDHKSREATNRIKAELSDVTVDEVLIMKDVALKPGELMSLGVGVRVATVEELSRDGGIRKILRRVGLDWRTKIEADLSQYAPGVVGSDVVEQWLKQFEALNVRWIGERILRSIVVYKASDIGDALGVANTVGTINVIFGFNKDKWGKSWGVINTHIKKRHPDNMLVPIEDALQGAGPSHSIKWIEDGLFSATEVRSLIDSLLDRRGGKTNKIGPLKDVSIFFKFPISLRYAVVCDFGIYRLRKYLAKLEVVNVTIDADSSQKVIQVLSLDSDQAKVLSAALLSGSEKDFDELLCSFISPFFLSSNSWKDGKKSVVEAFLANVGSQLWKAYLRKNNWLNDRWPEDRIRRCALGMDGLGLVHAFPHSVPKASLPLLWASGEVTVDNKKIAWNPLFPNA